MLIEWKNDSNIKNENSVEVIEVILEVNKFKVEKANLTRVIKKSLEEAEFDYFNFFKNDEEMKDLVKTVVNDHLINSSGKDIIEFAFLNKDDSGNEYPENTVLLVNALIGDEFIRQLSNTDIMDVVESYAYAHDIDVFELDEDYLTRPFGRIGVSLKNFSKWLDSVNQKENSSEL